MPHIRFTKALQRHVDCPAEDVDASTVRDVLEAYFLRRPQVAGYVLDERGHLRTHMSVFVDGKPIRDRARLDDEVAAHSTVEVLQALSGG